MAMLPEPGDMSVPGSPLEFVPTTYLPGFACGNGETFGDGTPALKLQTNRPLVFVRDALPDHAQDEIWSWMKEGHARWGAVCDWQARRIMDLSEAGPNDYVQLVTVADLGGGGILADQMLPYTGGRILRMRINSRVSWKATDGPMPSGTIDPVRTLEHETGHFMGHAHFPTGAPPELMEPYIQQGIIRPQPTEGRVSAAWFGPPVAVPPVPPTPPPSDLEQFGFDFTNKIVFYPGNWSAVRRGG